MQHGGEEYNEESFPDMQENTLRSDAVPNLLGEQSEPLIALFPMKHANTHLGDSLPMLRRCREASQEDALRPDAHPKPKGIDSKETIYLKAQSN